MATFQRHLTTDDTWLAHNRPELAGRPIAYFCAEFGLHNSVPIYSGGLGVLAGDHLKSASDMGVPIVGVGLFYTNGYFDQKVNLDGWQTDSDEVFDLAGTPIQPLSGPSGEEWVTVVETSGRPVHVRAWKMMVGRVPVYLLDTNLEVNAPEDRALMNKLYAGGRSSASGRSGSWAWVACGCSARSASSPAVWHANEGHAAFMFVERLREQVQAGASFEDAVSAVRARSVFTTHTPVPAGHDFFELEELVKVAGPVWESLGVDHQRFFELGAMPGDETNFHMTVWRCGSPRGSTACRARTARCRATSGAASGPTAPGKRCRSATSPTASTCRPGWRATSRRSSPSTSARWRDRLDDSAMWDRVLSLDHESSGGRT